MRLWVSGQSMRCVTLRALGGAGRDVGRVAMTHGDTSTKVLVAMDHLTEALEAIEEAEAITIRAYPHGAPPSERRAIRDALRALVLAIRVVECRVTNLERKTT